MRYSYGFNFQFGIFIGDKVGSRPVHSGQKKVTGKTCENMGIIQKDSFALYFDNPGTMQQDMSDASGLHQILMQKEKTIKSVSLYKHTKKSTSLTSDLDKIYPKEKEPYNGSVILGCILLIIGIALVVISLAFVGGSLFFVSSILGFVSVLMNIAGLVEISRGVERGKILAIIGLVFGFLLLVAGFVALIASSVVQ